MRRIITGYFFIGLLFSAVAYANLNAAGLFDREMAEQVPRLEEIQNVVWPMFGITPHFSPRVIGWARNRRMIPNAISIGVKVEAAALVGAAYGMDLIFAPDRDGSIVIILQSNKTLTAGPGGGMTGSIGGEMIFRYDINSHSVNSISIGAGVDVAAAIGASVDIATHVGREDALLIGGIMMNVVSRDLRQAKELARTLLATPRTLYLGADTEAGHGLHVKGNLNFHHEIERTRLMIWELPGYLRNLKRRINSRPGRQLFRRLIG